MCLQLSISSSPHSPVLHQSLQILFYAATQIQAQTRDLDSAFSKLDEKKCHSVVFQEVLSPSCTTPFSFFSLRQLFTVTTTVLTQVTTLFDCVYVFKLLWHAFKKRETPFSVFEKQTKKKKNHQCTNSCIPQFYIFDRFWPEQRLHFTLRTHFSVFFRKKREKIKHLCDRAICWCHMTKSWSWCADMKDTLPLLCSVTFIPRVC